MAQTATATDRNDNRTSTQRFREDLRSTGQTVRDEVGTLAQDARDMATDAGRAARRQVEPVEGYIREHPVRCAFIAAGVGLIFGRFLRSR